MVSTFKQPSYTTQSGTEYPLAIDASIQVMSRIAGVFAAHEQATPNMSVQVDPGVIFSAGSLTEVAAQSTPIITAPSANPRIDRLVIDATTGVVQVLRGAEASPPSPPAIPGGKLPVARFQLTIGMTEITNADIIDERVALGAGGGTSSKGFRVYTTPGDHVLILPASVNAFFAQLSGGGGGGDAGTAPGGGPGAGGWALFENLPFGAQVNIRVGAGGRGANSNASPGGPTFITIEGVTGVEARAGGGGGQQLGTPGSPGVWQTTGLDHQIGWNGSTFAGALVPGWSPTVGFIYGRPGSGGNVSGRAGIALVNW